MVCVFLFLTFGTDFANKIETEIMKNTILFIFALFASTTFAQSNAYNSGEKFKFRIHYGFVNAGYATLELKEVKYDNKKVFHAKGYGYTTGMTKMFFKVKDDYQSYFDKATGKPYKFIRKIDEGGYTKDQEGYFDQEGNTVLVNDHKANSKKRIVVSEKVQDIVSSFYYLRNHPGIDNIQIGEHISIDMFFDDEISKFKLKYLGKENIKTKFGTITSLKFRPFVQSGRVFKEEESLTVWFSADKNKIPLRIEADLAVGSLKADLESYSGIQHNIKFN